MKENGKICVATTIYTTPNILLFSFFKLVKLGHSILDNASAPSQKCNISFKQMVFSYSFFSSSINVVYFHVSEIEMESKIRTRSIF